MARFALSLLVAAVAFGAGASLIRDAPATATDEQALAGFGERYRVLRTWSYRLGGCVLLLVGVGVLAALAQ